MHRLGQVQADFVARAACSVARALDVPVTRVRYVVVFAAAPAPYCTRSSSDLECGSNFQGGRRRVQAGSAAGSPPRRCRAKALRLGEIEASQRQSDAICRWTSLRD